MVPLPILGFEMKGFWASGRRGCGIGWRGFGCWRAAGFGVSIGEDLGETSAPLGQRKGRREAAFRGSKLVRSAHE